LTVPVRGDAVGKQAVAGVRDLRHRILPRALDGTGADALVGGKTAENVDYFDAVTNPAPLVFAFVLGLSLVLLTIAFRSLVVALTAIVLNLLSVGAAYGLLVLVCLHGVGTGILGIGGALLIDATVIRSVVLPSMMKLLGRRNWYLPSWLEWLPHVEVERAPSAAQLEAG